MSPSWVCLLSYLPWTSRLVYHQNEIAYLFPSRIKYCCSIHLHLSCSALSSNGHIDNAGAEEKNSPATCTFIWGKCPAVFTFHEALSFQGPSSAKILSSHISLACHMILRCILKVPHHTSLPGQRHPISSTLNSRRRIIWWVKTVECDQTRPIMSASLLWLGSNDASASLEPKCNEAPGTQDMSTK